MAYPMGLPEWDSVRHCLEDGTEALAGQQVYLAFRFDFSSVSDLL
jgi:hypothetical protein